IRPEHEPPGPLLPTRALDWSARRAAPGPDCLARSINGQEAPTTITPSHTGPDRTDDEVGCLESDIRTQPTGPSRTFSYEA
ncbi:MAG: hypothetical protein ACRCYU_18510, partial [Nocardioides sp.]